jgi:hypothetical protein
MARHRICWGTADKVYVVYFVFNNKEHRGSSRFNRTAQSVGAASAAISWKRKISNSLLI